MNTSPKPGKLQIGPLSRDGAGRHAPVKQYGFTIPERITNASSAGIYTGKQDLSYRGQEVRHPSRGTGC